MVLAFRFSAERRICDPADSERVSAHLAAADLPTCLEKIGTSGSSLAAHMAHDKKASGGRVAFVLARGIGAAFVDSAINLDEVAAFLDREAGRK